MPHTALDTREEVGSVTFQHLTRTEEMAGMVLYFSLERRSVNKHEGGKE